MDSRGTIRLREFLLRLGIRVSISSVVAVAFVALIVVNGALTFQQTIEDQYLESTYEIFRDELAGNLVLGSNGTLPALLNEIRVNKRVGVEVISGGLSAVELEREKNRGGRIFAVTQGGDTLGYFRLELEDSILKPRFLLQSAWAILVLLGALVVTFVLMFRALRENIFSPLSAVLASAKAGRPGVVVTNNAVQVEEILEISESMRELARALNEEAQLRAFSDVAKQVAHDIASPLAALAVAQKDLQVIDRDLGALVAGSSKRIREIVRDLRPGFKLSPSGASDVQGYLLVSAISELVGEKKAQFRHLGNRLRIESEIEFGLFVAVQQQELMRVLSNILNNAVEALGENGGSVSVKAVQKSNDRVSIEVRDTGSGISAELLPQLGKRGVSVGKTGGRGLGLSHAMESVSEWGGSVSITSQLGGGTCVALTLPSVNAPLVFRHELVLPVGGEVVICDDDLSVHDAWKIRFKTLGIENHRIQVHYFSSPLQLMEYIDTRQKNTAHLFLVDQEFDGEEITGAQVIIMTGIAGASVLVTARHSDLDLMRKLEAAQVPCLPKELIGQVPIHIRNLPQL